MPTSLPISPAQAARIAKVSRRTIMRAIENQDLKAFRDNRNHWKIAPPALEEWASTQCAPTEHAQPDLPTPPTTSDALELAATKAENRQLRERLSSTEVDRDRWQAMAEKLLDRCLTEQGSGTTFCEIRRVSRLGSFVSGISPIDRQRDIDRTRKLHRMLEIRETALPGVLVLTPRRFGDNRGFFSESWNKDRMAQHGLDYDFVQDNHSLSAKVGTVRGLHFQAPPHAQAKLVRCGKGRLFDVAVDIRKGSPTYGQWVGEELSFENGRQLMVPAGFLHGFATLEPDTEIIYKCTDYYAPDCDGAVRFDDPDIGIDWGVDLSDAVLSEKDAAAPFLKDFDSPFTFEG